MKDARRPGRKKAVAPEVVQRVVEATLQTTPPAATHWTIRTMARTQGLSRMTVQRIWKQHGLRPHRVETFTLSRGPHFVEKLRDVVGLYLDPPDKALVLSVDGPLLPLRPGIPARRPTTTSAMGRPRCLRRSACWTTRSSASACRAIAVGSSSAFWPASIASRRRTWTCT